MKFTTSSNRSSFETRLSSCFVSYSTIGGTISLVKFPSLSEKLQTVKLNLLSEISFYRLHVPTTSVKIAVWRISMKRRVPCPLFRCFQTSERPAPMFSGWIWRYILPPSLISAWLNIASVRDSGSIRWMEDRLSFKNVWFIVWTHGCCSRGHPFSTGEDRRLVRRPDKHRTDRDQKSRRLRIRHTAGAAKSAIAQSIAELCEALLAASFFFSRTAGGSTITSCQFRVSVILNDHTMYDSSRTIFFLVSSVCWNVKIFHVIWCH